MEALFSKARTHWSVANDFCRTALCVHSRKRVSSKTFCTVRSFFCWAISILLWGYMGSEDRRVKVTRFGALESHRLWIYWEIKFVKFFV